MSCSLVKGFESPCAEMREGWWRDAQGADLRSGIQPRIQGGFLKEVVWSSTYRIGLKQTRCRLFLAEGTAWRKARRVGK